MGQQANAIHWGCPFEYLARDSTGHQIINPKTDPRWVSYLGEGALYTNFGVSATEFLIFLQMLSWVSQYFVSYLVSSTACSRLLKASVAIRSRTLLGSCTCFLFNGPYWTHTVHTDQAGGGTCPGLSAKCRMSHLHIGSECDIQEYQYTSTFSKGILRLVLSIIAHFLLKDTAILKNSAKTAELIHSKRRRPSRAGPPPL